MSEVSQSQPFARILDCSEEEYFQDPCEVPSLSQSIAHVLVSQSPLHAWAEHPKLGKAANGDDEESSDDEESRKDTAAKIAGKVIHKLLLGKGSIIQVVDAKDFRSNVAKAEKVQAKAAGRIPVIASKYQKMVNGADIIREVLAAEGYVFNGESEVSIQWHEPGEHGPVVCRCRLDHVFMDRGVIWDLKKTRSAHPEAINRALYDYGADIQAYAYKRALAALRPDLPRIDFRFLFVEDRPPYAVTPTDLSPAFEDIGQQRWDRAVLTWERCLRTNHWPKYIEGVHVAEPAAYVMRKEIGSEW